MKILYALQATGNGHIARANVLIPKLRKEAEVDVFISGQNAQLPLNFKAKHNKGISLFYSKKGGLDYKKIIQQNSIHQFLKSVKEFPVQSYDLIINDFEPVTAYAAKKHQQKIIGVSHQAAVLHKLAPKPEEKFHFSKLVFQKYAPIKNSFGLHFTKYDPTIFHPILRDSINSLQPQQHDYFLVYLPSFYNENIYKELSKIKEVEWIIFSPSSKVSKRQQNCTFMPIDEQLFVSYLTNAKGVLCGAGFEFPAEVLQLKKMLYVIPIKGQFEQYCNFLALKELGVTGSKDLNAAKIKKWIESQFILDISFKDESQELIERVLSF